MEFRRPRISDRPRDTLSAFIIYSLSRCLPYPLRSPALLYLAATTARILAGLQPGNLMYFVAMLIKGLHCTVRHCLQVILLCLRVASLLLYIYI